MNTVCPKCGLLPSPGRLAFHHRHVALSYVRRNAPDLHSEACSYAYAETERHGLTFDDYVARLETIIERIDAQAGPADETCDEPGITLSEAVRRTLRDEGHPLFKDEELLSLRTFDEAA